MTPEIVSGRLFELADEFHDTVMDGIAAEIHKQDRPGGLHGANRTARARINPGWKSVDGRLAIAPGKLLLSKFFEWVQTEFGISMSAAAIAMELRPSEISDEVTKVLAAIEYGEPFEAQSYSKAD
jgi:hypothetical protein